MSDKKKPEGLKAFIAREGFAVSFRGSTLEFKAGERYLAEPELEALVRSTDKRVAWVK